MIGYTTWKISCVLLESVLQKDCSFHRYEIACGHCHPYLDGLERITSPLPVFVDYAHSPDALAHVLKTLRPLCSGKLITVFGCGGDRDAGKRPLMGSIAEKNSDICVVTSDNPRSESPTIIDDITKGMEESHPTFTLREEAIAYAIANADPSTDVVLIAGKGHETYQEILGVKHPFDDRVIATRYAPKGDEHAI